MSILLNENSNCWTLQITEIRTVKRVVADVKRSSKIHCNSVEKANKY